MSTLIIDNYDSFSYNLFQYIGELGGNPKIHKNDRLTLAQIQAMKPTHIIISPGPGTIENHADFGICREVILKLGPKIPLLGVCLGHQGICSAFGGILSQASEIMHGKTSAITHNNSGIFTTVENPFQGMRYHSLAASWKNFPSELEVTATILTQTDNFLKKRHEKPEIMALQHKIYPIFGIQFHPESIGTKEGKKILRNFLTI